MLLKAKYYYLLVVLEVLQVTLRLWVPEFSIWKILDWRRQVNL